MEGKNIWKRSTMETQIQVAQTSLRERITVERTPNKVATNNSQENAKDKLSSPVYISTNDGGDQHRILIKCISCDGDNKHEEKMKEKCTKEGLGL